MSGYDRFADHVDADCIRPVETVTGWRRLLAWILKPLLAETGSWYGRRGLLTELRAARRWMTANGQIFHFIYGENAYRYLGVLKRLRRNFVVCTYHTPPARFRELFPGRTFLDHVDAVIVLSSESYGFFADLIGKEKVFFTPHGVDTDYFKPAALRPPSDQGSCVFVGSHLRDFETLAACARALSVSRPQLTVEIVTPQRNHHYFQALGNVTLRHDLSDEELLEVYQRADLCVMPLLDATANNSLLEAIACGLPLVVTDLTGVRDYVDTDCARFVPPGDGPAMARAIEALMEDEETRLALAAGARARAEGYDFAVVAQATEAVYREVSGFG